MQVEHQLDVIAERIRNASRRGRQLARLAAVVTFLNRLDAALDFTDVLEVVIEARAICGSKPALETPGRFPVRETVLQRGVRADEAAPGSGLGLAIVADLVELYGGSIALSSSPLGGLRAPLRLPAA